MIARIVRKVIRKILPASVKDAVHNSGAYKNYKRWQFIHYTQKISHRAAPDTKPEVAIFILLGENWNSFATMYKHVKTRSDINITVYVFPGKIFHTDPAMRKKLNLKLYQETTEFFERNGIDFVKAYDTTRKKWINVNDLRIDYLFYDEPYGGLYPEEFSMWNMYKRAKICYVPYGFSLTSAEAMLRVNLNKDFVRYFYVYFAPWSQPADYAEKIYDEIGHEYHHVENLGFPRFDLVSAILPPPH